MDSFTDNAISEYAKGHTSAESPILRELHQIAEAHLGLANMICGSQAGQLLKTLTASGNYKRILEIGTFIGYSAITMADAMDEGEIITLEIEQKYAAISKPYFEKEPYRNIIRQKMGPALESIDALEGPFDLVFIDADKPSYPAYYKKTLPKLRKKGVMVIDNTLWSGEVLNPQTVEAKAIDKLNKLVRDDHSVSNLLLPLRDGLMIVLKDG